MDNLKKVIEALKNLGLYEKVSAYMKGDSIYWQRNPIYKGVKLGNSDLSFQNYGCFLCSLSYCAGKDPIEVNALLAREGGMTKGGLIVTPRAFELLGFKYIKTEKNINNEPKETPTIKEVSLGKSQHFVVRIIRNGKRLIYDPWVGKELPINAYSFRSYRIFDKG